MRFILIDRILELQKGKRAVGIKNVTMSEDFLADHFPGYPVMPGVLILETMVQLASWLITLTTDFKLKALLKHLKQAKFKRFVRPGDTLVIEVNLASMNTNFADFQASAKFEGQTVSTAEFQVSLVNLVDFEDPSSTKNTFKILSETLEEQKKKYKKQLSEKRWKKE